MVFARVLWFWGGGGPGFNNTLSTQTEGTLYINIIDATTKQLVWQGKGKGGYKGYRSGKGKGFKKCGHSPHLAGLASESPAAKAAPGRNPNRNSPITSPPCQP